MDNPGAGPGADAVRAAVERLERAASSGVPCAPVRDLIGTDDIDTAYAVQREIVARRVAAGDLDPAQVRAAVDHHCAALEIVDSRIAGWDITFGDTVADNGSSGLYVLGPVRVGLDETEPVEVTMTLLRDGEVVSTGEGSACLGDPLAALAWLARTARAMGDPLHAGEVVLSGALGPMVPVTPGESFRAELSGLGDVAVTFDAPAVA